jgi:hypothetical protein
VEVLKGFYRKVRPWGFWQPIHDLVVAEHPGVLANTDFRRDLVNVAVGILWQTALTAAGIYLVLKDTTSLMWTAGVIAITSLILKMNWLDKLQDYPADLDPAETNPSTYS